MSPFPPVSHITSLTVDFCPQNGATRSSDQPFQRVQREAHLCAHLLEPLRQALLAASCRTGPISARACLANPGHNVDPIHAHEAVWAVVGEKTTRPDLSCRRHPSKFEDNVAGHVLDDVKW